MGQNNAVCYLTYLQSLVLFVKETQMKMKKALLHGISGRVGGREEGEKIKCFCQFPFRLSSQRNKVVKVDHNYMVTYYSFEKNFLLAKIIEKFTKHPRGSLHCLKSGQDISINTTLSDRTMAFALTLPIVTFTDLLNKQSHCSF